MSMNCRYSNAGHWHRYRHDACGGVIKVARRRYEDVTVSIDPQPGRSWHMATYVRAVIVVGRCTQCEAEGDFLCHNLCFAYHRHITATARTERRPRHAAQETASASAR